LHQLNILSRKQSKYCQKLSRLNNIITDASRNLFTSARCSCDAVYSSAQWQLEVSAIFWDSNFNDIRRNATDL